jgi:hypothetical protein
VRILIADDERAVREALGRALYSRLDVTLRTRVTELSPTAVARTQAFHSVIAAPAELVQLLTPGGRSIRPPYQVTLLPTGARERKVASGTGSAARRSTSAAGACGS